MEPIYRVVKGGGIDHVSRKIKQPFSQFMKNITLAFHASRKIEENILENHDSREKKEPFHISREIKRVDHGSRKYPLPPSIYV